MYPSNLDQEIRALKERLAQEQANLRAHQSSLASWRAALATDEANGASAATIANTQRRIQEESAAVAEWTTKVSITEDELRSKEELRKAIDRAAADAIAKGVNPDEAYRLAEAQVVAQKRYTTIVYVVIAITLVGLAVYAFTLWRKSRK